MIRGMTLTVPVLNAALKTTIPVLTPLTPILGGGARQGNHSHCEDDNSQKAKFEWGVHRIPFGMVAPFHAGWPLLNFRVAPFDFASVLIHRSAWYLKDSLFVRIARTVTHHRQRPCARRRWLTDHKRSRLSPGAHHHAYHSLSKRSAVRSRDQTHPVSLIRI